MIENGVNKWKLWEEGIVFFVLSFVSP